MESIDALANAIKEFPGGVMIVSHDFRLLSQVAGASPRSVHRKARADPWLDGLVCAEEIWEVVDRKIVSLSKQGVDIVEYKKRLQAASQDAIARAQLLSKKAQKGA